MNNNSIYSRIFNKNTSLNDNKEVINLKENKIDEYVIENKKNNIDLIDNYNDKIYYKNLIDNKLIKYIGFFYPHNNINTNHPVLPLKLCKQSPIKNVNSKDLLEKIKLIQKKYAGIKYKIGFSTCRICNNNNKCNEFYLDYFVWPAGYIHYLEDHNVEIDDSFKEYIEKFDFNTKHFRDFDYQY